jgi:SAM-dependent methyltransferase
MGSCPVCRETGWELIELPYPLFRHMDFATVKDGGRIGRCRRCQALFNVVDRDDVARMEAQFSADDYATSHQTSQTIQVAENKEPLTRSRLQADIIAEAFPGAVSRVLDIGCFDGRLLRELGEHFPKADLHGFDVNPFLEDYFRDDPRVHFWAQDLDKVFGRFDLICMSHSMMYIADTAALMSRLTQLLSPDGVVFIQVPDITRNPFSLLFCDTYYHYTPQVLINVLGRSGFEFTPWETDWFPREVMGFARRLRNDNALSYQEDIQIHESLRTLKRTAESLREIDDEGESTVLGTTINAAFVDSILKDRIAYFSDENPAAVGTRFRGKNVVHPSTVPKSDLMIMPYGEGGPRIVKRFSRSYEGRYRCV